MKRKARFYVIKLNRRILILVAIIILAILAMFFLKNVVLNTVSNGDNNKIVVDPGHGGIDGGTSDRAGFLEKDINLDVALKLRKELKKDGFRVIMTREKDESLEEYSHINASRYKRDLNARKTIIDENKPIVFVSIHVNSSKKTSARGVKVYYYPTSTNGEKLAKCICKSVDDIVYKDFLKDNSIRTEAIGEDYFVLRETENTGVLVEVGFITNPEDNRLIKDSEYQKRIAIAISEGIKKYIDTYDVK